eukprot:945753-Pleurochrysis_carterae.AAC.1
MAVNLEMRTCKALHVLACNLHFQRRRPGSCVRTHPYTRTGTTSFLGAHTYFAPIVLAGAYACA